MILRTVKRDFNAGSESGVARSIPSAKVKEVDHIRLHWLQQSTRAHSHPLLRAKKLTDVGVLRGTFGKLVSSGGRLGVGFCERPASRAKPNDAKDSDSAIFPNEDAQGSGLPHIEPT